MQMALNGTEELIDIHHAGTAMRFLTAYFAEYRKSLPPLCWDQVGCKSAQSKF
jgi:hypothetical protein